MFTRKKKAIIFKRKMLQFSGLFISSHVLGTKLVMGQRNSLFSLNQLVETDEDDNIFPRQGQNASFPAKFVLTSDIVLVE